MYSEKDTNPKVNIHTHKYGGMQSEYKALDIKRLVSRGEISEQDYYWYPGMSEWKKVSEFPFDNPPVIFPIPPSFFQRLNHLFLIFWGILNVLIIITSLYLWVSGFEKNHIVKDDYLVGIPILMFSYVVIYALFLSIMYLLSGEKVNQDESLGVLALACIIQLLIYIYILK